MKPTRVRWAERLVCVAAVSVPLVAALLALGARSPTLGAIAPAVAAALPVIAHPGLSYRNSWVGNTWGFAHERWVQDDVQAMAVTPQGDVYTNTPWDEAGGELGHYRDGELLGYGGSSHGWGMVGGDAIAVNDKYVFAAQIVGSLGNAAAVVRHMPPEGVLWYGVSRRRRDDFRNGAPFEGEVDWPWSQIAFKIIATAPHKEDYAIRGLAADATRLFVSDRHENRVDAFDADTMQPVGHFPALNPGRIAIGPDGSLWIVQRNLSDRDPRIVHYTRDGKPLGTLALPSGALPSDLAFDAAGRLLVADNGPRQQVLIYTKSSEAAPAAGTGKAGAATPDARLREDPSMQMTGTFGVTGGIYSGHAGEYGPLRFNGITGVGADRAGNLYVAMNGLGPRGLDGSPANTDGTVIESYTPDGKLRFSLKGLLFVDGAQFVDGDPQSVYSGTKRFTLDLSKPTGEEWSYAGYTVDRFRYPYDPYLNLHQGQRGTPLVRDVDGHRLLYTIDMTASILRIYRFDGNSETAIPSGLFMNYHFDGPWPPNQPPAGEWIWRDTGGAGRFAQTDFDQSATRTDGPRVVGWWVDSRGDIWQAATDFGIRQFRRQGFDRVGNPVYRYAAMRTWAPPEGFNRVARVEYFPEDDTMYVSGSTPERPYVNDNWRGMGSRLARYDHWSSGKPVLRYVLDLPDEGRPSLASRGGFAVAGAFVFVVDTRSAAVLVYDRANGHEIGRIAPGPETGSASGIVDVPMPVTAHRLASGEYLIFVEDDWHGKSMMYRFTPPAREAVAVTSSSN